MGGTRVSGYSSSQDHSSDDVATASAATFGLFGREGQRTETKSREVRSVRQRGGFSETA